MGFHGFLKQGTTGSWKLGPFVSSTDGDTESTGLTITDSEVRLSKNGGNFAAKGSTSDPTHDELGYYDCPYSSGDTDTVGRLRVVVHETGALHVDQTYYVVEEDIFEALLAAGAAAFDSNDRVDVANIGGSAATGVIRAAVVDDDTRIDASALNTLSSHDPGTQLASQGDITGLNDPTASAIADAVWDEARSGHTSTGSFGEGVASVQGNVTGSVASVSGAVGSVTGNVGGSIGSLTTGAADQVNAQADLALTDYDPPTKAELDSGFAGSIGSVTALSTGAADQVNAAVVDVIRTDTLTLPGQGAPTATPTLSEAVSYLYKVWRNKRDNDGSTIQYYADNGTTVDHKASVTASTSTVEVAEVITGP